MAAKDEIIYVNYMTEVKNRIDFLQRFDFSVFPKQVAVELIALQLRKLAEMLIFASLVVNRQQYAEMHSDFKKHWRIKEIIKRIKQINQNYLPTPIKQIEKDGKPFWEYPTGPQFFTESDLVEIYEESSGIIHSYRPFSESTADVDAFLEKVNGRLAKMVLTLNHHKIHPPSGDDYFVIHMLEEGHEGPVIYGFRNLGPKAGS